MKKIIVLGNSGSGKSTFTKNLSKITNIDALHLDVLIYKHDWKTSEYESVKHKIDDFINKDTWIIDGNFLKKSPQRFTLCDTIYFLDINRFTCLFSVIYRYFKYKGKHRDSKSDLCDEKLSKDYLKWVFINYYKTSRKYILNYIENCSDKKVIIFKTRRQIRRYLKEISV
ncbi:MAG: hypothetical protein MR270_00180 [Erysipelotrichaceae bacterium]|nr:hypothetical protein [Erysipelotrichaceae bacterium]